MRRFLIYLLCPTWVPLPILLSTCVWLPAALRNERTPMARVLQGAPPRGRQLYFNFPSAPDPLFKAPKAPFLTLRVATPSGAPRQALLDQWQRLKFQSADAHPVLRPRRPARKWVFGPSAQNRKRNRSGNRSRPENRKNIAPKIDFPPISHFWAFFSPQFSGRDLFLDLFRFLFWAEGSKPIF